MDTSDPGLRFDAAGICNKCQGYEVTRAAGIPATEVRKRNLEKLVAEIKRNGAKSEYDCIVGVSGGVDSTYSVYIAKKLGLRPLAVHLDNGWNTELAVSNIEHSLRHLGVDLFTHVLDWDEFRDLQVAFLKASTPDSEIPTDHAIVSSLYRKAAEEGLRYILWGFNVTTEGIAVPDWSTGHIDWRYISSVHRAFGEKPLRTYPHLTLWNHIWFRYFRRIKLVPILDYVEYDKQKATETITKEFEWRPYSGKHHESVYTRFYQSYILPKKFGFDKRRLHLSDMIMAGLITRDEAIKTMLVPPYTPDQLRDEKAYVLRKLGLSEQEFDAILARPPKKFGDYPSYTKWPILRLRRFLLEWRKAYRASRQS
jgi:N-acetyl sugar amidotransferase